MQLRGLSALIFTFTQYGIKANRIRNIGCLAAMDSSEQSFLIRSDGLTISYDPYSPEMVEKYGAPGSTDSEGFNPYADTVGPGIVRSSTHYFKTTRNCIYLQYGGRVHREESTGYVLLGRQYQDHNPKPGHISIGRIAKKLDLRMIFLPAGPIYAGGGYTPMSNAVRLGESAIQLLLDKYPELVNEVTTGGATPLHMCGMGESSQLSTEYIIARGGNIESVDTYGYTPLHRMASNNLAVGAQALLDAGANLDATTPRGETALSIARQAGAHKVIATIANFVSISRKDG